VCLNAWFGSNNKDAHVVRLFHAGVSGRAA